MGPAFQFLEAFRVIYGYPGPWQLASGLTGSTEPLYKQLLRLASSLLHSPGSRVTDGASQHGGSPNRQASHRAGIFTNRGRSLRPLYKIFMIITILPWQNQQVKYAHRPASRRCFRDHFDLVGKSNLMMPIEISMKSNGERGDGCVFSILMPYTCFLALSFFQQNIQKCTPLQDVK